MKKTKTIIWVIMFLITPIFVFAQVSKPENVNDYDFYLQKARQRLAEGDCDGAQRVFNVYKELTDGTTDVQLERQLGDCLLSKEKPRRDFVDSIGDLSFTMVYVEGGTDTLGRTSSQDEKEEKTSKPHVVTLSGYYIGKYEVTVAEFETFVKETGYVTDAEKEGQTTLWMKKDDKWDNYSVEGLNWRYGENGKVRNANEKNYPVLFVSWNDAIAYCEWLKGKTGKSYCLPSEAQWEFAARGGKRSKHYKYAGGNVLDSVGWSGWFLFGKCSYPIGHKKPNELGIFDMSGNAQEWCGDCYGTIDKSYYFNPTGSTNGDYKVVRGGAWSFYSKCCQVSHRHRYSPTTCRGDLGFRVAITDLTSLIGGKNDDKMPIGINLYSVSNTQKVQFSPGNLQYQPSTKAWRFAEHQWEVRGGDNAKISKRYKGWIDLFGWGTGDKPTQSSTTTRDYGGYFYDPFHDWGENIISNGEGRSWRTLSIEEWSYVFFQRPTNWGIRFAKAIVNGVKGVILLPDGWDPEKYNLKKANTIDADFICNSISQSDWIEVLEKNGAVFLPVAGARVGETVVGTNGYYWSTTICNDKSLFYDSAYCVCLDGLIADYVNGHPIKKYICEDYIYMGSSVRLVSDVEN